MPHLGHNRSWLQTGGLPVEPAHAVLRAHLDSVVNVAWIGAGCFKLYDGDDAQVGLVQFQGELAGKVDDQVLAAAHRAETGEAAPVDREAGDTLIRPLDPTNPADAAVLADAVDGVTDRVVGAPLPPDLPDELDPPPPDRPFDKRGELWPASLVLLLIVVVAGMVAGYMVGGWAWAVIAAELALLVYLFAKG